MICQRCGAEIDTRYTFQDGSLQCPRCGQLYQPVSSVQQAQYSQTQYPTNNAQPSNNALPQIERRRQSRREASSHTTRYSSCPQKRVPLFHGKGKKILIWTCSLLLVITAGIGMVTILGNRNATSFQREGGETVSKDTTAITNSTGNTINGLMLLREVEGEVIYYPNGQPKCQTDQYYIDIVDPDTGECINYRSFSVTSNDNFVFYIARPWSKYNIYFSFLDDYTKMAAVQLNPDGSMHIGWVTQDGQFTDITNMIDDGSNGVISQSLPCFYQGYVYYTEKNELNYEYVKKAPLGNLKPSAVVTLTNDYPGGFFYIKPDGSISTETYSSETYDIINAETNYVYFDSKLKSRANREIFCDWINEDQCIGKEEEGLYLYSIIKNSRDANWYSKKTLLASRGTDQYIGSAVLSPDKQSIAYLDGEFLSGDALQMISRLHIISIDGSNHRVIRTSNEKSGFLFDWQNNIANLDAYIPYDPDAGDRDTSALDTFGLIMGARYYKQYEWTDSKGYTYEVSLHFSPWILQSDSNTINAYQKKWNTSFEGMTPSMDSWNINHNSGFGYYHPWQSTGRTFGVKELSDMYYLWGSIEVRNVTKGWHFTNDSKGTPDIQIQFVANNTGEKNGVYKGLSIGDMDSAIMTKVYYDNDTGSNDGFVHIQPSMTGDNWGPCSFLVAHAESFTPKNPDGLFREYMKDMTINVFADYQLVGSFNLDLLY